MLGSLFSKYQVKKILSPALKLRGAIIGVLLGLAFFLVGFLITFRNVIFPFFENIHDRWYSSVSKLINPNSIDLLNHYLGGILLLLGFYISVSNFRTIARTIIQSVNPDVKPKIVNTYIKKQILANGPNIVAIGGGTGLSTLLRGLKEVSSNITAIVTVTDDGGSTGRIVKETSLIPPGDIRNCLVSLADDEKVMTSLFQHRFKISSGSLSGHSVGNLLLLGLAEQYNGDFQKALDIASEVLSIRGRVLPSTFSKISLNAVLENGTTVYGESNIASTNTPIDRVFLSTDNPPAHEDAISAINNADLICLGPGSVFTSVIPSLLISEIREAIENSDAYKIYICNVMTQPGESTDFAASHHVKAIEKHINKKLFNHVLVNTGVPTTALLEKYVKENQHLVYPDVENIKNMGYKILTGSFISESDYCRHDASRIATRFHNLLIRGY